MPHDRAAVSFHAGGGSRGRPEQAPAPTGSAESPDPVSPALGLRELAERIYDNGTDGVLAYDDRCRAILWSSAMEALTGARAAEVLGRSVFEVFPMLAETGQDRYLREALLGRSAIVLDRVFISGSGNRTEPYEALYVPLHGSDGSLAGGVTLLRSSGERHRIDQRMRETESRFRTMADCAPVLLWMAGTEALCDFFNQGWLDFTGRTLEQEMGVGWAEGVHPEDLQPCLDHYMASFASRSPFEMVYRLRRADGEFRWILDRGAPRHTPDGAFAGYIGSCIDITDRKVSEDALKKSADDLTRSNLELERFAHVASHDLQEPLRMVANFTELLAARCRDKLDEEAREYIRFAVDGAKRMKDLIDGLIAFSRIGRSASTLFRSVDCSLVLDEALSDLTLYAAEAGAQVTRDPLPTVRGDPVYLGQLFRNLIHNAIKFRGEEPSRVHVSAAPSGSFWVFSVRDNGIGFDMKFAERIFVIFQRLHRREDYEGDGIGLSICRRIVELHGGRLWAQSSPGAGSAFFFTLQAVPPAGQS